MLVGTTVWLTGLPAAGKTTIGSAVVQGLEAVGARATLLDGDRLREGLSSDLGFTLADRAESVRRAGHAALLIAQTGVIVVVALVSPVRDDRDRVRALHGAAGVRFFEVWVDTPLTTCEARDPKGLYARARRGELPTMTGVGQPYEPPPAPELRLAAGTAEPEACAAAVLAGISGGTTAAPSPDRASPASTPLP